MIKSPCLFGGELFFFPYTHPLHIIIVEVAAPMLISSLIQPWEIFNPSGGWISAHCWWSINSPSQNEHFRQLNRTAIPEKVTAHYNKHQWLLTLFAAEGAFQHQPLRGHFWGLLCFRADLWLFNISASNRVNQQMNYQKKIITSWDLNEKCDNHKNKWKIKIKAHKYTKILSECYSSFWLYIMVK